MYVFVEVAVLMLSLPILYVLYRITLRLLDRVFKPTPEQLVETIASVKQKASKEQIENERLARELSEANTKLGEVTGTRSRPHSRR